MAGNDVILWSVPGDSDPDDVRLRDPSATAGGGGVTYADNLSVGAYLIAGQSITDSVVRADSLSTGSYSISGKSITDVVARADALSVGAYAIAGAAATDIVARADNLSAGSYAISGQSITDVVARADNLSAGAYVVFGKDITDVVTTSGIAYADDLSAGAYVLSGQDITDEYVSFAQGIEGGGGRLQHGGISGFNSYIYAAKRKKRLLALATENTVNLPAEALESVAETVETIYKAQKADAVSRSKYIDSLVSSIPDEVTRSLMWEMEVEILEEQLAEIRKAELILDDEAAILLLL